MIEPGGASSRPHLASPAVEPPEAGDAWHVHERLREGVTMALYISLSLLAVLVAQPTSLAPGASESPALAIVLTAVGLIVAHWLAFRLSTRLVHRGQVSAASVELIVAARRGHRISRPASVAWRSHGRPTEAEERADKQTDHGAEQRAPEDQTTGRASHQGGAGGGDARDDPESTAEEKSAHQ
jgi:hypothetical protein